ncbi:MAG: type II toxin-antitoxin system RatA family toxin [Gammaproteobacteria bacterium]|nr:type II toxin-antitoxin system RatA family toxin [Gammaproteobacteria bacterium]MDH5592956.1 type II toxin-antitoxin system RatA family toxin [Gammaproteobacteria bacterium]
MVLTIVPNVSKSALIPYSAKEMYDLVADISGYSDFLPWCGGSEIISVNGDEVRARIDLAYKGIQKSFSTINRNQSGKMIEMRLQEGPFKHLEGFWRFESLREDASKVLLDLNYEFSGKILQMTVGPVFNEVANRLVDSFCQRAVEVYGKR